MQATLVKAEVPLGTGTGIDVIVQPQYFYKFPNSKDFLKLSSALEEARKNGRRYFREEHDPLPPPGSGGRPSGVILNIIGSRAIAKDKISFGGK